MYKRQDVYDPNWDQSTQDGYVDQAINESPDAIVVIPVSADHAGQQFKKITKAGIPAFCSNTLPEADAMNNILAYTGPNDWYQMRNLASKLGEELGGKGGVCYITHNVGTSPYYARTFGPMSTLAEEYPDIKSLDVQSPGFEASAVKDVYKRQMQLINGCLTMGVSLETAVSYTRKAVFMWFITPARVLRRGR